MGKETTVKSENGNHLVEVIEYTSEHSNQFFIDKQNVDEISDLVNIPEGTVRWINVDDKIEQEQLEEINNTFNIHHLIYEDIRNNKKRVKIEEYDDYLYVIAKMVYYVNDTLIVEHMNFILGKNYVISFGETKGDVFDNVRERISKQGTRIRKLGADYLLYSLLDTIVDEYFEVLDVLGEKINQLEEHVIGKSSPEYLNQIREVKNKLLIIYKYFWPLREVISWMVKDDTQFVQESTQPYFRDVHEHIVQVIETTEVHRELLAGLTDLYISNTSNRLNEIMKVLTVISTIFIPLTFIVGVYGMNFKYMPELGYPWGYPIVALVMVVIAIIMVIFFKRKKWF